MDEGDFTRSPHPERRAVSLLANPLNNRSPSFARSPSLVHHLLSREIILDDSDEETATSSFWQAAFNTFNVIAGIGVLSLPFAFKQTGWVTGSLTLGYLCIVTNYTAKLLGRCMELDPRIRTYSDIGSFAFGARGSLFISVLFCIELVAVLSMYLTLMGDSLETLIGGQWTRSCLTAATALLVLPTCWTSQLNLLSHLSIIGIISSLLLVLALINTGFTTPRYGPGSFYNVSNLVAFNSMSNIPYAVGLEISGFAGHAVFPSIYDSLTVKNDFPSLINWVYVSCSLLYMTMALMGYFLFSSWTKEELTLNLYDVAGDSFVVKFTVLLMVVNPFTKFALTLNPLASIIEQIVLPGEDSRGYKSKFLRSILTGIALLLALTLPSFASICAFIGAFCSFIVSVIFPLFCYLKLYRDRLSGAEILFLKGLIALNSILCIVGTAAVPFGPQTP